MLRCQFLSMNYFLRYCLIIALFFSVSCNQNPTDKSSEEDENNGNNPELSSKTESYDPGIISTQKGGNLTALEVKDLIEENPDVIILDVRTPEEFKSGSVENAINLNIYSPNFIDEIRALKRTEAYLLYCAVGGRSSTASELMKNEGFTSVFNSKKGFSDLKGVGITTKE